MLGRRPRGFGGSDPLPVPNSVPRLAAFVAAFADAVGIDVPAHVVGNSLGGAVALQFAVDHPERVRTLALADPAGFGREVTVALRLLTVPSSRGACSNPAPRRRGGRCARCSTTATSSPPTASPAPRR